MFCVPLPLNLAMTWPAPDRPPDGDPPPLGCPEAGTETVWVTAGAGSVTVRVTVWVTAGAGSVTVCVLMPVRVAGTVTVVAGAAFPAAHPASARIVSPAAAMLIMAFIAQSFRWHGAAGPGTQGSCASVTARPPDARSARMSGGSAPRAAHDRASVQARPIISV